MTETAVRQVSLPTKIRQVTGLAGTISVDEQTNAFLEMLEESTQDGKEVERLTPGQIKWIDRIFAEHFA